MSCMPKKFGWKETITVIKWLYDMSCPNLWAAGLIADLENG